MLRFIIFVFFAFLTVQCSQKNYTSTSTTNFDQKETMADNFAGTVEEQLANMLRRTSGVQVVQNGNTYLVRVRGVSSLSTQVRPLYVIDGISMGNDFNTAASAIAGNRIKSIRVLKGQDASFYGTRGAGGVIVVKTEKPELSAKN